MKSPKKVTDSAIEDHVYKVFPNDLNARGTAFGGMIMVHCDRLSLVVAERHSGQICVTASVDSMHFMAPAQTNDNLIFKVAINRAWHSSMEIGVKVLAENSYTGEVKHIVSAYSTFVALDEQGKPVEVPELIALSESEHRRFEEAGLRRESRLAMKEQVTKYRENHP